MAFVAIPMDLDAGALLPVSATLLALRPNENLLTRRIVRVTGQRVTLIQLAKRFLLS